jgi:NAD(P)-dependent dehydrogenase (short-subunit alcohol dehydrogenase family)
MDLYLKDRVAIVTGSGRGIGRAIALTLAAEGVRVCVNDIFDDRIDEMVGEIRAAGGEALGVSADVTDRTQVESMVRQVVDAWGTVHILVNNAGIPAPVGSGGGAGGGSGYFQDTTPEAWPKVMDVITFGVLHCTQACLPQMVQQQYGKIVSIISDAGRVGEPRLAVYSMAKAGVVGFSKALAKEVGRFKINVNCVSPGVTQTESLAGSPVGAAGAAPEERERFQALLRQYPMGRGLQRIGQPQDIANAVAFLVSDRAEWITGQVLSVNGGYAMVG